MSKNARARIFSRLNSAKWPDNLLRHKPIPSSEILCSQKEKIENLKKNLEAVQTEVHIATAETWTDLLKGVLRKRKLATLLYAPETAVGEAVNQAWNEDSEGLPQLTIYRDKVENFKESLFEIDAAITSTRGGIAETGALILWPDQKEPRLMSLIPPVHIAVLKAENVSQTFTQVIEEENWSDQMPTNAILISGPSKTADIELVVAFGVHGPKELIVFIIET